MSASGRSARRLRALAMSAWRDVAVLPVHSAALAAAAQVHVLARPPPRRALPAALAFLDLEHRDADRLAGRRGRRGSRGSGRGEQLQRGVDASRACGAREARRPPRLEPGELQPSPSRAAGERGAGHLPRARRRPHRLHPARVGRPDREVPPGRAALRRSALHAGIPSAGRDHRAHRGAPSNRPRARAFGRPGGAELAGAAGGRAPARRTRQATDNAQAIDFEISDSEATRLDEASRRWR
jgi:hypothetical protein